MSSSEVTGDRICGWQVKEAGNRSVSSKEKQPDLCYSLKRYTKQSGRIYCETTGDGLYAFAWKKCEKTGRSLDVNVSKGTDPR
jgi:hypothetical protein